MLDLIDSAQSMLGGSNKTISWGFNANHTSMTSSTQGRIYQDVKLLVPLKGWYAPGGDTNKKREKVFPTGTIFNVMLVEYDAPIAVMYENMRNEGGDECMFYYCPDCSNLVDMDATEQTCCQN